MLTVGEAVVAPRGHAGIEGVVGALPLGEVGLRLDDVRQHPVFSGFPASHPRISSVVAVPIEHGNVPLGGLYVFNKQGGSFSDSDHRSLEMLAARVGYALEIARLNKQRARELARLDLLSDIGRALPSTLDLQVSLDEVARLCVPRFADLVQVFLADNGGLRLASVAHRDPEAARQLKQAFAEFGPDGKDPHSPLGQVFAAGEAVIIPRVAPSDSRFSPEAAKFFAGLGLDSVICLPVVGRNGVLGVLGFGTAGSGRHFDSMDLGIAEEIAFRIALTLDNVRLYEQAQAAVRSRDIVMAMVSHDLRNPLNAIFLNLGVLARHDPGGTDPATGRRVDLILQSAQRLNRMVEDLLTSSTIEAGKLTVQPNPTAPLELFEDLLQAMEPAAQERSLALEVRCTPGLPQVQADRDRVLQVLSNLVTNAIKVSPPNRSIRLEARAIDGFVCFSVADPGPGVPPAQLPLIFDRYWKGQSGAQKHGVGLGRYIVRGIVESHGGSAWVESPPGGGATFFFTLPISPP